ncbi:hypothetical protein [Thalassospira mesophila]|uniref:hypothetical protein n=1 Tax=Thalassospira mesophila TaxID=1293891 RepID=UPI000A1EF66E|nr:hypothetical protein [Thalassospira mesophila]
MQLRKFLMALPVVIALGAMSGQAYGETEPTFNEMSADEIRDHIENKHPAAYYILAQKLFNDEQRQEAVFWFYAGQLRYRVYLTCHPDLPPDGDPALFGSLSEQIGRPLNVYAFGDVEALTTTIDRVLDWDRATPNGFTPKTQCVDAVKLQRAGLDDLRRMVTSRAEDIRQTRRENGLPNH